MKVFFTPYARFRMAKRRIEPDEVLTALSTSLSGPPGAEPADPRRVLRLTQGSLTVIYRREGDSFTVLNVLRQ